MSGSNNFLQWDPTKNNMQSQANYAASAYRSQGAQSGAAPSNVHNKLFYQISTLVAALGESLAVKGYTVSDESLTSLTDVLGNLVTMADLPTAVPGNQTNPDWNAVSGPGQILNKPPDTTMPIGAMVGWMTTTPPTGFLECNGASVSKTTYAGLYAVIGGQFGSDALNFNLPDMRGFFARGWDHGAGRDPDAGTRTNRGDGTGGDQIGTRQAEGFKAHTHTGSALFPALAPTAAEQNQEGGPDNYTEFNIASGSTGGNETRPVNISMMYIIRYQ